MNFLRWLASLFGGRKKGYRIELPIGFQKKKKHKRLALFGGANHFKKGGKS